jgi:hypothetical protein
LDALFWYTLDLAVDLQLTDLVWCAGVSMPLYQYLHAPSLSCEANDLFIKTDDMVAPHARRFVGLPTRHTLETQSSEDIRRALEESSLVPPY